MNDHSAASYDAIVVVSFGGPDKREDVIPFLENVLRGRNVPQERMREVAEHYYHLGGKSPINDQNRALVAALERELARKGPAIPVYLGNRNWHPLLADTLREMATDGVRRALAFVTSAYGSYSGCRQYLDDIARAQQEVGASAPSVDKLRLFYNHPGFIEATAERVKQARDQLPSGSRAAAHLVYTAHSIPTAMAADSPYVEQLHEACRLVSEGVGRRDWTLVYQSRSGSPSQPWLEPDINNYLRQLHASEGPCQVIVVPIGFISDHMEVLYDLDTEARALCEELGLVMVRAATVGVHPRFIDMIRDLILERMGPNATPHASGNLGPWHNRCPADCCPRPAKAHRKSNFSP